MTDPLEPAANDAPRVVVGIDGSEQGVHALAWALHKADRLGRVTPVMCYQPPRTLDILTRPTGSDDDQARRAAAAARLDAATTATDPTLADRARAIESHPGPGLVELADAADLLVVGTRGRSLVATALLGSVSQYCVNHASIPVVVVPMDFPADKPLSTIVVGVDGSPNSEAALRWAIEHVEPDGKIYAAGALSAWGYMAGEYEPTIDVMEKQVLATVEAAVESVRGLGDRGPDIIIRVIGKDARVALRELATAEGDMLVIGARGMTGMPHLILGSVSTALIHHPTVPTVVFPSVTQPPADSTGAAATSNKS